MADIVPHDQTESRLDAMREEQRNMQIVHEQRLTQVETRMTMVEVKLPLMETAIDKLTRIADTQQQQHNELAQQSALNEQAIIAIRERTDMLAEHMEKSTDAIITKQDASDSRLDALDAKVGKHDTKWAFLQAVGLAALGVGLGILVQHIPH